MVVESSKTVRTVQMYYGSSSYVCFWPPTTCFSDTVLDLIILDGFFFSELCNCFLKFIQCSQCRHWHSQLEGESCCSEIWGQKHRTWRRESSVWVRFSFVLCIRHVLGASSCMNGNKLVLYIPLLCFWSLLKTCCFDWHPVWSEKGLSQQCLEYLSFKEGENLQSCMLSLCDPL